MITKRACSILWHARAVKNDEFVKKHDELSKQRQVYQNNDEFVKTMTSLSKTRPGKHGKCAQYTMSLGGESSKR